MRELNIADDKTMQNIFIDDITSGQTNRTTIEIGLQYKQMLCYPMRLIRPLATARQDGYGQYIGCFKPQISRQWGSAIP